MNFETIVVEKGTIANIIINRTEKSNSLNQQALTEITQALYQLDDDDGVRVIVISGAGKGFCAGGDLGKMDGSTPVMEYRRLNKCWPKLFAAIASIGKLVIAKVHGYALAGGFGLSTACDFTVIAENTKLGTPEMLRALYPFVITAPLARCIPQKKLMELCFLGEWITPQQALEYGACNYVVSEEKLDETVDKLAQKLSSFSPTAIRLGKEAFNTHRDMDYLKSMDYLCEMVTTVMQTSDVKEGIQAFFEKRPPHFTGK